ncbi:MAG: hypothetical protein IKJ34_00815 [Mailhella sp.]|nr:hypothetical protein [Mailhella sp.]MBR3880132.1 hypothetical protein [Mailhella sp.]
MLFLLYLQCEVDMRYRLFAFLEILILGIAPCRGLAIDTDKSDKTQIIIDGKPLGQWIEEQKSTGRVITGDEASRIGVIENDGRELVNVKRRTVIQDSIVIPNPKKKKD